VKIVVIGAGEIGFHTAKILSQEKHDIIVVDHSAAQLERVNDALDVMTVQGIGSRLTTLRRAQVETADVVIAVTSSDDANFAACVFSHKMGAKRKFMRTNDADFFEDAGVNPQDFGIDMAVSPERLAAKEIVRLIRRTAATDIVEFAEGRIQLIGIKLDQASPLINRKLRDVLKDYSEVPFRAVAISRGLRTIIPTADDVFRKGDQVFVISKTEMVPEMLKVSGKESVKIEDVMILGGTAIGQQVAADLEDEVSVKLIESSKETSSKLADVLKKTMVIRGEGKDLDLLATEGIMDMDAYVAVTRDEEDNIISCLMAKHLGVKKAIAHVEKTDYIPLANTIGIDALVNKKLSAATEILKLVRKGEILSIATLHGVDAEMIEMIANHKSAVTKKPVRDLKFPEGGIIGCVIRNEEVIIPVGDTRILSEDRVVVLTLPRSIHEVEKFFH